MALDNIQKQDLRHAVRRALAARPRAFFGVGQVSTFCRRLLPFTYTLDDVADALHFLKGLGHVEQTEDPYGAERLYRITAEGELQNERAETA